jgi:hypothetical protein
MPEPVVAICNAQLSFSLRLVAHLGMDELADALQVPEPDTGFLAFDAQENAFDFALAVQIVERAAPQAE